MGTDIDARHARARARRLRGLRDIHTLGRLRRSPAPARGARPVTSVLALRIGLGQRARSRGPVEFRSIQRPRTWVFVKRPGFRRHQGTLLVDRLVEPDVDVFEEGQAVTVLAALPDVEEADIDVHVSGDVLTLATKPPLGDRRRYYRELLLPFPVSAAGVRWSLRNGVLDVELSRAEPPDAARRTPR